jgi:hypothetical protein
MTFRTDLLLRALTRNSAGNVGIHMVSAKPSSAFSEYEQPLKSRVSPVSRLIFR